MYQRRAPFTTKTFRLWNARRPRKNDIIAIENNYEGTINSIIHALNVINFALKEKTERSVATISYDFIIIYGKPC